MGSLMLLVTVSGLLACSQSASVKIMKKESVSFGKRLNPLNSESCYNTQTSGQVVPVVCPQPDATECAVLSFYGNSQHFLEYACATEGACKDPADICMQVSQQVPFPISNCTLKCCKGTNCNKPQIVMTVGAPKIQIPSVHGLTMNKAMASTKQPMSCYTTQPDQTVIAIRCDDPSADRCATLQFDMAIQKIKLHEKAYACSNEQLCNTPKLICDEIAKEVPYPISNCVMKCCSDINCNKPTTHSIGIGGQSGSLAPVVGSVMQSQGAMQMGYRRLFSPKNAMSCYVTDPQTLQVTSQQCPGFDNRCGTVVVDFVGPSGRRIHDVVYACSVDVLCQNPTVLCQQIAKSLPSGFKIIDCTLTCCSGDNCNHP